MNADLFGKGGGKPNFQRSSHAMYHNLLLVVTFVPLAWSLVIIYVESENSGNRFVYEPHSKTDKTKQKNKLSNFCSVETRCFLRRTANKISREQFV